MPSGAQHRYCFWQQVNVTPLCGLVNPYQSCRYKYFAALRLGSPRLLAKSETKPHQMEILLFVLEFLTAGDTKEEIPLQYPDLEMEDIDACLRYKI